MHRYDELEQEWKKYRMKKIFKLYTLPVLTFIAGLGVYYLVFTLMHPSRDTREPIVASIEQTPVPKSSAPPPLSPQTTSTSPSVSSITPSQQEGTLSSSSVSTTPSSAPSSLMPQESIVVAQRENTPEPQEETLASSSDGGASEPVQGEVSETSNPPTSVTDEKSAPSEICYAVTVPVLNIRQAPTINAEVVGKYQQDDIFCKIEEQSGWVRGEIGWVFAKNFTRPVNTNPKPPTKLSSSSSSIYQNPNNTQQRSPEPKPAMIDTRLYPVTPPAQHRAPKPDLTIQSTEISQEQRLAILKEKFQRSQDPQYAIQISNYYYDTGDYQTSNSWAVAANDIDKTLEDSWILFAKSAFMLGKQEEAIKSIKTYLQNYESQKAQILLQEMRRQLNTRGQP